MVVQALKGKSDELRFWAKLPQIDWSNNSIVLKKPSDWECDSLGQQRHHLENPFMERCLNSDKYSILNLNGGIDTNGKYRY